MRRRRDQHETPDQQALRERFLAAVSVQVDPSMRALGFTRNIGGIGEDNPGETKVLYEHDPEDFARRFPVLADDFGTKVAPCIDVWVKLDTRTSELERDFGDLFEMEEWLRKTGSGDQADLIWDSEADIVARMGALAEAFTAYFAQPTSPWDL